MKLVCTILIIISSSVFASNQTVRLSEPTSITATSETFGAEFNSHLPMVTIAELATKSINYISEPFQVKTRIAKVCQKKGCFFIAQQNEHVIRVSFKDYGFFIPTDSDGKTVLLTGELIQQEMTAKQAAHYTKDLQAQPGSVKPGLVYEIVATSIIIPKV